MIEGKKISELPVAQVLNEACCFPLLSKGATSKITFATLLTNILANINIDDSVEIVSIKESIKKMSTSIELTDKQIDKINNQITELNKEVDSQDALIVKYIKLVESLQEAYDEMLELNEIKPDSFLDESSRNPVQNKVIVEALNEKANIEDVNTALENKVDKEEGKGLSTNDFTDEYKIKVDLLSESGGEGGDNSNIAAMIANKVDKEEGKGLSTNDFTDEYVANIESINTKIPNQASEENKLADKAFVNSSIQTATANFRGNWDTWNDVSTDIENYPVDYAGDKTPTTNDYLVVKDATDYSSEYEGTWRFKYVGDWETNGKNGWQPEYQVNETPMTSEQLAAINSGITTELVDKYNNTIKDSIVDYETTWSSSKINRQILDSQKIKFESLIGANSTLDTGWNLAQGDGRFYGRLLQLDGNLGSSYATYTYLLMVKANHSNPTEVYCKQIAGLIDKGASSDYSANFELGVSENGTLTITNKTTIATSYRFI